ncbi:MAG: phosphatase PAP2 family protein [Acholeplasmataceae bacterium]
MDASIIRFLRDISNPVTDWIFYIITQAGGEIFFIIVGAIIYWAINKKYAFKFVMTYLIISGVMIGIKSIVKRPRPYTIDDITPPFEYYTDGYSFPSGHATSAGVLGYVAIDGAKKLHKKWLSYVGIAIMILIPISRMVLAQHYLTDVLAGLFLSFGLSYLLFKWIDKIENKEEILILIIAPIITIIMFIVQTEDLYKATGAFLGFAIGYLMEKYYVKYDVKNKISIQFLKILLGFAIVLLIKEGLKLILPDESIFQFLRYLLVGGWVAVGAPLTFKYVFKHKQEKI